MELALWDYFSSAFLDRFFPPELGEDKGKEIINLKQGKMSVKEYVLKFHKLSRYTPELVSSMRDIIRNLVFGFSRLSTMEMRKSYS